MNRFLAGVRATGVLLAAAIALSGSAEAADDFITIGTGGVTGVYYPVGGAVCRLVNKDRKTHGIRCAVESTGGSVDNIDGIRAADLEFGVVQSDLQYEAYHGTGAFAGSPYPELRAMFSVHAEPFTLVVRADSGIASFEDLRGKRVNVGNPGSGQRATMEVMMTAFGLKLDDFALATEFTGAEMASQLCDGNIDAMVYTVGHPAAAIKEAATTCDVKLVDVTGAPVEALLAENPYYRVAVIPGGMYRGNPDDVTTFGVGATLVSRAGVPDEIAYQVARAVLGNLDDFRALHPAFATLVAEEMIHDGLSAPLHPGAVRAYRELGLMP